MVSLSATVSNAEEFGDWLQAVRGDTDVIVSEERPVPLEQHVLVRSKLLDLFDTHGPARQRRRQPGQSRARAAGRGGGGRRARHRNGRPHPSAATSAAATVNDRDRMERSELVRLLDVQEPAARDLLRLQPGRLRRRGRGRCCAAACASPSEQERDEIRAIVEERCRTLLDEDLGVLGYWDWLEGLERGVAAHHAGMLPAFKEVVEELFQRKLVKVVFATETLALGINMPARTVVLEKLEKFNGEARVPITPGEYTQLTGRAGRRGIDVEGHSVIQWVDGLDPQAVASLASRRSYPLISSFRPTYNMAVNLIEQFGRDRTREILESSFAQFQADRAVVDLARKVREQEKSLAGYAEAMTCHLGDFAEYAGIRRELSDLERKQARNAERHGQPGGTRPAAASAHRPAPPDEAASVPRLHRPRGARPLGRALVAAQARDRRAQRADPRPHRRRRPGLRPGHRRAASSSATSSRTATATSRSARTGRTLRRIYGERDLLVAECLRRGSWDGLDAAGARGDGELPRLRTAPRGGRARRRGICRAGRSATALEATEAIWARADDLEEEHRLPRHRAAVDRPRARDVPLGAGRTARLRAARGRPGRGRLRALDEAGDRPARPALGRRRRRGRPHRAHARSTPSVAASSRTAASPERGLG